MTGDNPVREVNKKQSRGNGLAGIIGLFFLGDCIMHSTIRIKGWLNRAL